ncbi:DNA mismatch repair protein MutL [Pholiota conissans]|uniref:DNA mismatch repair protein MutL n=1 Tax=Pholiota conissans TaxID=109636 RepID=A0A9P6D299_9AGAR|nr:DNA mismatch repair protein MutL [Pholiota conissans]
MSSEPKPIRRLTENLINKIAAGEIIHRPASALKELIENSLDAGATSIRITVKDGGMKLLQIQDNGCGIRKSDMPILAERFTTSKLSTFSDLKKITTYGFRGEALASMSHVAHLSVVTKTKADSCAWKASYVDGALVDPKTREKSEPRASAGNDGTTITIEDLFYNTPTRLSALRSTSEEYSRILDVITKYAIHNPTVSFICRKGGAASPDISTPSSSEIPATIRLLYGHSIAKELIHHELSCNKKGKQRVVEEDAMDEDEDESEEWSAELYFTNANYQAKKTVFLLFINHRLVESLRIKKALEAVYTNILPKGSLPFIYLSLQIDPRSVDVNVHPTKREVHFLNEEAITERIADAMQEGLVKQNHSRTFEYQTLLTGGIMGDEPGPSKKRPRKERDEGSEGGNEEAATTTIAEPKKKIYSQHKVRTNLQDRTLDSMFPVVNEATQIPMEASTSKSSQTPPTNSLPKSKEVKESECFLTSVRNLRQRLVKAKHQQLSEILEKHTFIGIVDIHKCLSLIQCTTKLYLVNHDSLAEELFYQLGLRQFGDFSRIKLDPPPSLREMIEIAVEAENTETSTLSKSQIADRITNILVERREMLADYFSLTITEDGLVESIPLLLRGYTPNLDNLPSFLMRLGPQVDWTSEAECFENFLRELAYFYVPIPSISDTDEYKAERWQIQHVLFPAMRRYLLPPKSLLDRDIVQVADLPDLYKVFERC